MNESIKFTADSPAGTYATNDTGVMVAVCRDYTDVVVGVIRLTDNTYITAPLAHLEYAGGE